MQVFKYFYRVVIMPPLILGNQPQQGKAVIGILSAGHPVTDNEQLPFILQHIGSQIGSEPEHMDLTAFSFLGAFNEDHSQASNDEG
jgi:hypothetical protein